MKYCNYIEEFLLDLMTDFHVSKVALTNVPGHITNLLIMLTERKDNFKYTKKIRGKAKFMSNIELSSLV